jgi:ATP-dependent RNA helicase SUPV3L1/SUV3
MSIASRQWRLPLRAAYRVCYQSTTTQPPSPRPTVHSLLQSLPSNQRRSNPLLESRNHVLKYGASAQEEPQQFLQHLEPLFAQLKKDYYDSFSFEDLPASENDLKAKFTLFESDIKDAIVNPQRASSSTKRLVARLDSLWHKGDQPFSYTLLKKEFYRGLINAVFTPQHLQNHMALADFRYPLEAFPAARRLKRTIHLHVGPTNSGKTYHALKRLREATGDTLFAGPLRMLAQEIYARMNATGKPTWLITGDDKRPPIGDFDASTRQANISCTVEMVPLNRRYEVAVIDEIQMLADPQRGAHWTTALLGLCADEIHLCGEERSTNVIQQIADSLGEELIIHRYNRLTDLQIMPDTVESWNDLEKGDCVVGFSIKKLHIMRSQIELETGKKCAIVYGGLPSEVRTEQARLFNDPDNDYDFLVATNAIGMGLNLAIRRVIFSGTSAKKATAIEQLPVSEVKQIGGRAGRFRTSYQDTHAKKTSALPVTDVDDGATETLTPQKTIGYVTARRPSDLAYVNACFRAEVPPIEKIGFQPGSEAIARFYSYFPPGVPYSLALVRLDDIMRLPVNFFAKDIDDTINVADAVEKVKDLRIEDRIQICNAPVSVNIPSQAKLIVAMATAVSTSGDGGLLQLPMDLDVLDIKITDQVDKTVLTRLEDLHKGLVLYCWMSFRFPSVFIDRPLAIETRTITQEAITKALAVMKTLASAPDGRGSGGKPFQSSYPTRPNTLNKHRHVTDTTVRRVRALHNSSPIRPASRQVSLDEYSSAKDKDEINHGESHQINNPTIGYTSGATVPLKPIEVRRTSGTRRHHHVDSSISQSRQFHSGSSYRHSQKSLSSSNASNIASAVEQEDTFNRQ